MKRAKLFASWGIADAVAKYDDFLKQNQHITVIATAGLHESAFVVTYDDNGQEVVEEEGNK